LPATIVFSYSFLKMFVGLLVAKTGAVPFCPNVHFPLKLIIISWLHDPVVIIALMQGAILYLIGLALGMPASSISWPVSRFCILPLCFHCLGRHGRQPVEGYPSGSDRFDIGPSVAFLTGCGLPWTWSGRV
jgi:hypothetical protein